MALSVLIVDDHRGFREAARALLESDGYEVVGEAADGASGLRESRRLGPDVVLLDVGLPDRSGFDLAAAITGGPDPPAVVLVSSRDASDYASLVARSGARGFISKGELAPDTLRAVLA